MNWDILEDKLTALGESEMQMFRFLLDRPAGVILTVETDKMLARILESEELAKMDGDKVALLPLVRRGYNSIWTADLETKWQKRNWMYKCLEAGQYLYGVMTWDVLGQLFRLAYPNADAAEVCRLFDSTPASYQWFTERDGKLVLNGFEKDDYYKYLDQQIQGDVTFYIPTKAEVDELYDQGSLISREAHSKLRDYITETFGCDRDTAAMKVRDLYEAVNSHVRVNDAVEAFATGAPSFRFPSDEVQVKFIELFMEMSRECRIRDNRGHDYYEMVALMALKNRGPAAAFGAGLTAGMADGIAGASANKGAESASAKGAAGAPLKRVKIGRNDPCPCGSGKKYKNCCGRS